MKLGAFVFAAHQVVVKVVVRLQVAVGVHRDETSVLQKAGVNAATVAGIVHRHAVNHVVLKPLVRLGGGQVVDGRGALARVNRAAHHRHAARSGFAVAGHERNRGEHRHGGLAHRNHVHIRADVADKFLHISDVVIKVERAVFQADHARVSPIGDVDLVVTQQLAHGFAQQRGVVARQRGHDQHGGLVFHPIQCGRVVGEALEAQQAAKRFGQGSLLMHSHFHASDVNRRDAEFGLLVFLGQAVHQAQTR